MIHQCSKSPADSGLSSISGAAKAVEAGASVVAPLQDMFWGDQYSKLVDPFGHHWPIAEHLEDLSDEQRSSAGSATESPGFQTVPRPRPGESGASGGFDSWPMIPDWAYQLLNR